MRAIAVAASLTTIVPALADSTIGEAEQEKHAYSANAGWINARHDQPASPAGLVFGDSFLSGYAFAANFGWIHFGDGSPADGIRYQNDSAVDFGVNHDGSGNLSGYAFAANVGWINFGWASGSDPQRPHVDLLTGAFGGYAYSGNIGWINLGTGLLTTGMVCPDSDDDGISDTWERDTFNDLDTATATSNFDGDPASDLDEFLAGTDARSNSSYMRIVTADFEDDATGATVVFTTDPSRLYRLETSDTLGTGPGTWTDSGLGLFLPDAGTTTTRDITWPAADRKFVRAVPVKPLSQPAAP